MYNLLTNSNKVILIDKKYKGLVNKIHRKRVLTELILLIKILYFNVENFFNQLTG